MELVEDELSYDTARLSQALPAGSRSRRDDLTELGLESLSWLGDESGLRDDVLRLAGHRGRRRNEAHADTGDEKPLDAAALVEAEPAAFAVTGAVEHGVSRPCVRWFLGRNTLQKPVLRLRNRRLQRRARQRGAEPERGR